MEEQTPPPPPTPLDYHTPQAPQRQTVRGFFALICGLGIGVFGGLFLLGGTARAYEVLTRTHSRRYLVDDLAQAGLILLIGVVGVAAAIRWVRAALRNFDD